ncbi:thioredoxin domain-containing protein [Kitasatospora sp. RB6PN24]|uniref:DsbA family protein n=1 Tax=Kitasatospora humi TaxID=2893891 RepID=UPI001E58D8EE|nr:thioredoxin domain-containing protein [Kitasatospora humi]MCC9307234.1 thioredoxin domain-containing protein [Kitasatospora humi]
MSSTAKKKPTNAEQQAARRERLQQAMLAEQRAQRTRRRVTIGISSALALLLVGGVAIAVGSAGSSHSASSPAASSAPLVTPANTSGDGTVVTYGKPDAAHTLAVYEDFRCPICEKFETTNGATVQQLADNGDYKIDYHMAAFLDDNLGGKGSITALAAAGAALNQSVDDFKKFHDVLYANQPNERTDGFGDVNTILDLAGKVPGLKTDAFTAAVKNGTYLPWAQKVAAAFDSSGVNGTPTMKFDGKQLTLFDSKGTPVSADQFKQQVGAK